MANDNIMFKTFNILLGGKKLLKELSEPRKSINTSRNTNALHYNVMSEILKNNLNTT